ncbi:WD repeat-containing and planar cell polarity effector protein fritz homolog [Xenia sp. Carnegie-2017]|uniref:WD repeat-containing and planar cell polarity effector protein fritz homolog n=1 Tax=Xenia sp. Carnegie-2017 TaxID=2897299 RepID=UPI001F04EF68|nr:WD repeat-containing and planar cell polarity effector protein fritz homolog [Xenia sp. Carnegie-2017]
MATLWAHLHAWMFKKDDKNYDDIGVHVYHDKTSVLKDDIYMFGRQRWDESRDVTWIVKNKRPERLKDSIIEIKELIESYEVVNVKWNSAQFLQVLMSNCTMISFFVAKNFGDVEKIFIDKSLCGRISDRINAGLWSDDFMVLSFYDKLKIACINFARKLPGDYRRLEKLAALDPKITWIDLPGQAGRRLHRYLSLNSSRDMVSVSWSLASEEAWPWSPVAGDRARANLIVIDVKGGKFDVLAYLRTDCDPIYTSFSVQNPHHILTIESTPKNDNDHSIDSCVYKFHRNAVRKLNAISIPLKAPVSCVSWNHSEDKLLLGCKDKNLIMYDCHRLLTQTTKITFVPRTLSWHPSGTVVFILSQNGDIQVFDMALAPIFLQLAREDPGGSEILHIGDIFVDVNLCHVAWSSDSPVETETEIACCDNLFMVFQDKSLLCNLKLDLGSARRGRLGPQEMIEEYIKHNQAEEAVNFVNSINWNADGNNCFVCLSAVMNYLLKFPLTGEREGLLEETLGCFYAPSRPINDVIVLQYRDPLSRWSRKFFYHLLRYKRFQKAFMLAVDIGAVDLFMDIHFAALDSGLISLAENAKNKALEIDNELQTSATETDSSSGVEDDEALSFEEETFKITRASYFSGAYGNSLSNQSEVYSTSNEITQTNGVIEERQTVNALNVVDVVNSNQSIALFQPPLNTNITQDPEVWALANNIELETTENEDEAVIYL